MAELKNRKRKNPSNTENWKKIAVSRGQDWKDKLSKGRIDALLNPSRMRLKRLELRLDQRDVARQLSLNASVFGGIERGRVPVKADRAKKIAAFFKAPLEALFRPTPKNKNRFSARL